VKTRAHIVSKNTGRLHDGDLARCSATPTNSHPYIQTLRLHLIDICRVTQRCVDLAIRALELKHPDPTAGDCDHSHEIEMLCSDAAEIAGELLAGDILHITDFRFMLSSTRLCDALQGLYSEGLAVSRNRMRMLANGEEMACEALAALGNHIHALIRLCTTALFDEDCCHAEAILKDNQSLKQFAHSIDDRFTREGAAPHELTGSAIALANSLLRMVRHTHEMADAVAFWLKGTPCQGVP
jgi:hypothetical protein